MAGSGGRWYAGTASSAPATSAQDGPAVGAAGVQPADTTKAPPGRPGGACVVHLDMTTPPVEAGGVVVLDRGLGTPRKRKTACLGGRTRLRDAREQRTDLGLAIAAVTAERADRGELAALRPAGDRLRVNAEHGGDLGRRQQCLGVWGTGAHRTVSSRLELASRHGACSETDSARCLLSPEWPVRAIL